MDKSNYVEERFNLIKQPTWTYKEIMKFDNNIKSKTTAIRVKNRAIKEQNGSVKFGTQYVSTDAVLALYGTSRENELKILKGIINNEEELHKAEV